MKIKLYLNNPTTTVFDTEDYLTDDEWRNMEEEERLKFIKWNMSQDWIEISYEECGR